MVLLFLLSVPSGSRNAWLPAYWSVARRRSGLTQMNLQRLQMQILDRTFENWSRMVWSLKNPKWCTAELEHEKTSKLREKVDIRDTVNVMVQPMPVCQRKLSGWTECESSDDYCVNTESKRKSINICKYNRFTSNMRLKCDNFCDNII